MEKEKVIQDYWWEEELSIILREYGRGEVESESVILFVVKMLTADNKKQNEK